METIYDEDRCVTKEDLHGEVFEYECPGYPKCYKELYSYHTGQCPERTEKDASRERYEDSLLDLFRDK